MISKSKKRKKAVDHDSNFGLNFLPNEFNNPGGIPSDVWFIILGYAPERLRARFIRVCRAFLYIIRSCSHLISNTVYDLKEFTGVYYYRKKDGDILRRNSLILSKFDLSGIKEINITNVGQLSSDFIILIANYFENVEKINIYSGFIDNHLPTWKHIFSSGLLDGKLKELKKLVNLTFIGNNKHRHVKIDTIVPLGDEIKYERHSGHGFLQLMLYYNPKIEITSSTGSQCANCGHAHSRHDKGYRTDGNGVEKLMDNIEPLDYHTKCSNCSRYFCVRCTKKGSQPFCGTCKLHLCGGSCNLGCKCEVQYGERQGPGVLSAQCFDSKPICYFCSPCLKICEVCKKDKRFCRLLRECCQCGKSVGFTEKRRKSKRCCKYAKQGALGKHCNVCKKNHCGFSCVVCSKTICNCCAYPITSRYVHSGKVKSSMKVKSFMSCKECYNKSITCMLCGNASNSTLKKCSECGKNACDDCNETNWNIVCTECSKKQPGLSDTRLVENDLPYFECTKCHRILKYTPDIIDGTCVCKDCRGDDSCSIM